MGTHASSLLYAKRGSPPEDRWGLAIEVIRLMESHGYVTGGVSSREPKGALAHTVFDDEELTEAQRTRAVCLTIDPKRLSGRIKRLCYALPSQADEDVFELPFVSVVVMSDLIGIRDGVSGRLVAKTWAGIEFSYEDARVSPLVHLFRGWFTRFYRRDLPRLFGSPVEWGFVTY